MTATPRPRTSVRDVDDLAERLTRWLSARLPSAVIGGIDAPASNGMSSQTLLFRIEHPKAPVRECVLRLAGDPAAYTVFPVYDMAGQYRLMQQVAEHTDVPVPRVLWLEEDPGPLGAPFFVMERVHGRVPPDVMPYTYPENWLYDAHERDRRVLEESTVSAVARLHDQFPVQVRPGALRRHVDRQRDYYRWVVDGLPRSPLIEAGFAWLEQHWPRTDGQPVQSWGDARIGNVIYDQAFRPAAVLDWEMADVGPRELDLGWLIYLHQFFQDLTEGSGLPGLPGLLQRERVEETYRRLTGHTPADMDFFLLYAALRHAVIMLRIGYRQAHFGEVKMPDDPDALIMHRASLARMITPRT